MGFEFLVKFFLGGKSNSDSLDMFGAATRNVYLYLCHFLYLSNQEVKIINTTKTIKPGRTLDKCKQSPKYYCGHCVYVKVSDVSLLSQLDKRGPFGRLFSVKVATNKTRLVFLAVPESVRCSRIRGARPGTRPDQTGDRDKGSRSGRDPDLVQVFLPDPDHHLFSHHPSVIFYPDHAGLDALAPGLEVVPVASAA